MFRVSHVAAQNRFSQTRKESTVELTYDILQEDGAAQVNAR